MAARPTRSPTEILSRLRFVAGFVLALVAQHCGAVCIASGDSAALTAALTAASQSNAPPASIKLEQGTYHVVGAFHPKNNVEIKGGYVPASPSTCADSAVDASTTTIDLAGTSYLTIENDDGSLLVENFTVRNGSLFNVSSNSLTVSDVRVTDLSTGGLPGTVANFSGGVGSSSVEMTNVQLDHLTGQNNHSCFAAVALEENTTAKVNHLTVDLTGNFCFYSGLGDGVKTARVYNSIFWDSDNGGGIVATEHDGGSLNPIHLALHNSIYSGMSGGTDVITLDESVQQDPLWGDPSSGNYTLPGGAASPAVNTGTKDKVPGGEPDLDITGAPRVIGSLPDMGAYESPYDDYSGINTFNVTNTLDDDVTTHTLRWAIKQANAFNGRSLIQFLVASCPATIILASPLPAITGKVEITGYSMPTSTVNTSGYAFNAHLCIAIQPASIVNIPTALDVPPGSGSASLTVRGIGFGGFAQAINLRGGFSHQIVGNQFGGLMDNFVQLYGFTTAGVVADTFGSLIIGGASAADRNLFLNANSGPTASGVLVGPFTNNAMPVCQLVNNLIGIAPDGLSANPSNEYGIQIEGTGCFVKDNRIGGNIRDAIYITAGAGRNVVQHNVIGVTILNFSLEGLGAGIRVNGNQNVIGAGPGYFGSPTSFANLIANMDAGGVVIEGGIGNTVRGNTIYNNGATGSGGMNIDLGDNGLTANDTDDADNGANDLQNFPLPGGIGWTYGVPVDGDQNIDATVTGVLRTRPGTYQIDVYYARECNAAGGRGGGFWIGSADSFQVPTDTTTVPFTVNVKVPDYNPIDGRISVTATSNNPADYSTSELSPCRSVDSIFTDGFDN